MCEAKRTIVYVFIYEIAYYETAFFERQIKSRYVYFPLSASSSSFTNELQKNSIAKVAQYWICIAYKCVNTQMSAFMHCLRCTRGDWKMMEYFFYFF